MTKLDRYNQVSQNMYTIKSYKYHTFSRYYDQDAKKCLQFMYGGCRGNGNNFERYSDCTKLCEETSNQTTYVSEQGTCIFSILTYLIFKHLVIFQTQLTCLNIKSVIKNNRKIWKIQIMQTMKNTSIMILTMRTLC